MKRRDFIAGTAALLVSPRHSWAQGTPRRIGALNQGAINSPSSLPLRKVWRDSLSDHGWAVGKNLIIDSRYTEGHDERLPALAAELVALKPDVLVAFGPPPAVALKSATATIPIVFVAVIDPVALGLVQSLSRPGGNVTGLATSAEILVGKQVEILRELIPSASKIALLVNPRNPMHTLSLAVLPSIARSMGVALPVVEATTADELDTAFASAAAQQADAIIVLADPTTTNPEAPRVTALAANHHLPAAYLFRAFAPGGLIVYGADIADLLRRSGDYVDKILRGTKPADLPVEQPTKYELIINMKTAKALGLSVPPSLLVRADEVIE